MTLSQFNNVKEEMQAVILKQRGVFLASRKNGNIKILLYQIDAFYVEFFFDKYDHVNNPIRFLRTFEEVKFLDPYLKKISIKKIIGDNCY